MTYNPTVLHLPSFLNQLRNEGYAVTIFTPSELHDIDPNEVEIAMYTAGNRYILSHNPSLEHEFHAAPI